MLVWERWPFSRWCSALASQALLDLQGTTTYSFQVYPARGHGPGFCKLCLACSRYGVLPAAVSDAVRASGQGQSLGCSAESCSGLGA